MRPSPLVLILVLAPALAGCSDGTPDLSGPAAAVDRTRYLVDLKTIAAAPRPPGSAHHAATRELCRLKFSQLGFTVEQHKYDTGVNVVGKLAGTSSAAEEVLISAHYDSVSGCKGADDNGTGVAGTLEAARVLAAQGPFKRTLTVACWDEEEKGLKGSVEYAKKAKLRGDKIVEAFVFEMLGYRSDAANSQSFPAGFEKLAPDLAAKQKANQDRGDFILAVHDDDSAGHSKAAVGHLARMADQLGLKLYSINFSEAVKKSPLALGLLRSDHAAFFMQSYPAMMITDTANFRNPYYHCGKGQDAVETLDHDFAVKVIKATVGAAEKMLKGD